MIWLRLSWRDLRSRWIQVAAIAFVIAFGTGIFSGLRSMNDWRGMSNDASYEAANTFDLRVKLGTGSFVDRGSLLDALQDVGADAVSAAEERLVLPTQVSVETDEGVVIVPGRLIGVDLSDGGPHVNSLHPKRGRLLQEADAGQDVVLLEHNFAKFYGLPPEGSLTLTGGLPVRYAGQALAPEYFLVVTEEGGFLAQANFAAVFTSIETAQRLAGMEGRVNDLLVTTGPAAGASVRPEPVEGSVDDTELFTALESRFAGLGGTVERRLDDPSIRLMVEDVDGDRQFNSVLAIAIFGGAVFAAFNLTSRIVDAQRREIGIALALGVPPGRVALRPLLFSAQIALLGVLFGIAMGIGVAQALRSILIDFLPLPVWQTPFRPNLFVGVAVLGFLVPFAATAFPVWRAVRVPPIDAIRTGHLSARSGGLAWLLARARIPGPTVWQIPFRNIARAPRRTALTALAISAVVSVLVLMMGMFDSFIGVFDLSEAEAAGASPDRIEVSLDSFYPAGSPTVRAIAASPATADVEPGLRLSGTLASGGESFDVLVHLIDFDSSLWRPTIVEGRLDPSSPGLVISEKAAGDLRVAAGGTVTLRHPVAGGPGLFTLKSSQLPVVGLHAHPSRLNVYMDIGHAGTIGVEGMTNLIHARPAPGVDQDTLKRELFTLPGVGSVQKATASAEVFRDQFAQYIDLLVFIQAAVILLALVIAYNTASINMDERRREHATMFAYGLPVRSVLGMAVVESAVLGVMATLLGLIGGYLLLQWVVAVLIPNTIPDLGVDIVIKPVTLAATVLLGVVAVAVAPLFTVLRLRRMDVPSSLRVME